MGSSSSSLPAAAPVSSSTNSKSLGARHYGQWKDSEICKCGQKHWKCFNIRHQGVRMADQMIDLYAWFFTTFTRDFNIIKHHCLKLRIQCKKCGRVFYITVEHGNDAGVQLHHGYYQRELCVKQDQDIDISYTVIDDVYQLLRDRAYSFIEYNCIHLAYEFYRAVVERNTAAAA